MLHVHHKRTLYGVHEGSWQEDGEGAGVRARRGEVGRLGVGHGACLAQSFGPLATRAHEIDFRPENEQFTGTVQFVTARQYPF